MTETIAFVFYSACFVQIIFFAVSGTALILGKKKQVYTKNRGISIVIAARNEEKNLKTLIPSLLQQNYSDFEVIVSLDRCTDESEEFLSKIKNERVRYTVIQSGDSGGKKRAILNAIERSSKELLVFTDADCLPHSKNWLHEINSQMSSEHRIGIGFSPYLKKSGLLNLFIRYDTLVTAFQYLSFSLLGRPYMGVGRNLAIKKSLFEEVNGYDGYMHLKSGDDDLFVNKNGNHQNVIPILGLDSLVLSEPKTSFAEFIKQKQRHLSVGKYYSKPDQLLLGLIGGSQIIFWLTFIILASIQANLIYLLMGVGIRWLFLTVDFYRTTKLLGNKFAYWLVPILDIVYSIYLLIMAPVGFFTRRITWK